MNLSPLRLKTLQLFTHYFLFFSSPFLVASCATLQSEPAKIVEVPDVTIEATVETKEKREYTPLTSKVMYFILMAEIARQRGEITIATQLYSKVADLVESPLVAKRSTEMANYTRDTTRINKAIKRWLEVEPDNSHIYLLQLPSLIANNDFDGINNAINKALALAPNNTRLILRQSANNLSELDTPNKALAVLQKIDLYQQGNPDAYFIYAKLASFYKQYELALPIITQVLKQQTNREEALILKAEILQRLGKKEEALALLKQTATKKSASHDLLFIYAKLLGENNQPEQAYKIFKQLHTALPKNEEILFALGLLALEQKQGAIAKTYFSKLVALGDTGKQASYFMGLAEELEANLNAALIWFVSVPADSPRFQAAQRRYINILADNGHLDKALLHLKLLRKEQPNQTLQNYFFEGSFLTERQLDYKAFEVYTQALIKYPNHIELLYCRALVAESLSLLDVFESDLRKVLAQEPNNALALNALGYTLTDRTDRHQEALLLILKAIEISPQDPFYLDSLGWVYYRLGQLDKAIQYLKQAVKIQRDAEFAAHLGEVLWRAGKQSEAKQAWQQGLKEDKNNLLLNKTLHMFGQQ